MRAPTAGSAPADAQGALRHLAGTARQALVGVALAVVLAAAGWMWSQPWTALFLALLAAAAAVTAGMGLLQRLVPGGAGWVWAWLPLLIAVAAGAQLAVFTYRACATSVPAILDGTQMFGSALAFGLAVFCVPLFQAQRQAQALQLATLKQAALQAELKSLQAQVEPHFLFNTLANTRYLARHSPEQAVRMLDHLIAYLRAALPDLRSEASAVGRECELAEHYLALMAIRFGERLEAQVECPAALRLAPMPPLMLMTLVENAIRHGVEPKPGKVKVRVDVAAADGMLRLLVADDGAGLDGTVLGSGVGLRNLRERLAALYGQRARFELRSGAGGWTEAELALPLETGTKP
ncbi:histidine kinase [Massilia sp. METH4]|uniref:sensor histidine kinase n=1 Tax=Massilia sp. METH4 TaxID=3123041 RepID=UPI0030CF7523